jgi:uncharacterized membrane protein HdeD (DUF308 family)
MLAALVRNWWVIALRGAFTIIFGMGALLWPGLTLRVLILLFGSYALVNGIFTVIGSLLSRSENQRWWVVLLQGIVGIILGLLTFFYPAVTTLALLYLIAAWALITGIFEVVAGIMLRRVITAEWLTILGGIASIIFGLLLVFFPSGGALALTWLIGTYALVLGMLLIFLALRLRSLRRDVEEFDAARAARV